MPLTPADIHNTAFRKPPIGKRGYDEEQVDAFLDEAEQELIRLLEENGALQNQLRRGGAGGAGTTSTMALRSELADLTAQLDRMQQTRSRAEQNARSVQAQLERARSSAPSGAAGDDDRTAPVLMMAQRTADDHMRDAQRESDALLSNARAKTEQITSEAELKANTIESDARRNHSEAMNSLAAQRTGMLDEIDRLDRLARGYQAALNNHITRQLQDPNSAPDVPAGRELG
jgi:DivIVA domain-containing protein